MSANILRLVDALIAPFVRTPITGRNATADFGPTPAAVQLQRLRAGEAELRKTCPFAKDAHAVFAAAWVAFYTNSIESYDRVNALLDEFDRMMRSVPVGGSR